MASPMPLLAPVMRTTFDCWAVVMTELVVRRLCDSVIDRLRRQGQR